MNKLFHFGIIFKITLVLIFYISTVTIMGLISYSDLVTTENKIKILELSYNIHNNILESRRHEKNYFLYGTEESLYDNITIIQKASEIGEKIIKNDENLAINPQLKNLDKNLILYTKYIYELLEIKRTDIEKYNNTTEEIRHYGKIISEISEEVVNFEKTRIHTMVSLLREQLVTWSSIAIFIGIVLSVLIVYFVFKPLSAIKKATESIARGRFIRIEVINTKDEIQQVMEAFNIMVSELERRQDQLIQAEKLSSLGTLTAGVAHQLNNPLNNISTSCQIAIDEFDSGDVPLLKRMLQNIDQETLRARDVVKSLLEFSRTQEFNLRQSSLTEVAHKAVLLAKSQVPPDIGISIDIPEDLIIPMDVQRIQEVFINLIINAAQAIERQGQIAITATVHPAAGEVAIEIHDTGQGIPDRNLAKVFDPFFTTKEEGQGTGLGLSVVYGIIQQHRGNITVQSHPGQGTSFFIRLPFPGKKEH
jgi:two-component system, NtrC family, sensor kinase